MFLCVRVCLFYLSVCPSYDSVFVAGTSSSTSTLQQQRPLSAQQAASQSVCPGLGAAAPRSSVLEEWRDEGDEERRGEEETPYWTGPLLLLDSICSTSEASMLESFLNSKCAREPS